jgi:hypothetical protein
MYVLYWHLYNAYVSLAYTVCAGDIDVLEAKSGGGNLVCFNAYISFCRQNLELLIHMELLPGLACRAS